MEACVSSAFSSVRVHLLLVIDHCTHGLSKCLRSSVAFRETDFPRDAQTSIDDFAMELNSTALCSMCRLLGDLCGDLL